MAEIDNVYKRLITPIRESLPRVIKLTYILSAALLNVEKLNNSETDKHQTRGF